jgi:hypothetical protein
LDLKVKLAIFGWVKGQAMKACYRMRILLGNLEK